MKTTFTNIIAAFSGAKRKRTLEIGKTYITHFRNYDPEVVFDAAPYSNGGITVAFVADEEGKIKAAVSVCSACDNFCRRIGRERAMERLQTKEVGFYYEFDLGIEILSLEEFIAIEDIASYVVEVCCPFTPAAKIQLITESKQPSALRM